MEMIRDEMAVYRQEMLLLCREIQESKDNINSMVKYNLNNNNNVIYHTLWPDERKIKDMKTHLAMKGTTKDDIDKMVAQV